MVVEVETDGIWVTLTETIAAHHEEVFECFTTSGGLTRWFPVSAEVDLRPGGQVTFGWDQEFQKKLTSAILDFDEEGRITWDWYASNGDAHAPVYWTIEPEVEEGARVVMRQGPFGASAEALMGMAEEAVFWRWYLCNLRGVLESRHDMRRIRPL